MPFCPKCGNEVDENATFCPKCGASLKAAPTPPPPMQSRNEKQEKDEKREKDQRREKGEKREKGEYGMIGPLVGGLILIMIGIMAWLQYTSVFDRRLYPSIFLIAIGVIIMIVAIYVSITVSRRHPRTPV